MARIPRAFAKEVIKKNGGERVTEDACVALNKALLEYGNVVATKAATLAKHSGRHTVTAGDIALAKAI